jgi:molybdopterin-guanine dinucleotide biosynthesis protein A
MGTNKALLEIDGKRMIRLVADVLKEVCNEVIIVGGSKEEYSALEFPWYPDTIPDRGPLGGIYTALQRPGTDVVIAACDLPNINSDLLRFLLSRHNSDESCTTVLRSGSVIQPLLGVYHSTCLPILHRFLESGGRKVLEFLDQCKTSFADLESAPHPFSPEMLLNLNTYVEYQSRITK